MEMNFSMIKARIAEDNSERRQYSRHRVTLDATVRNNSVFPIAHQGSTTVLGTLDVANGGMSSNGALSLGANARFLANSDATVGVALLAEDDSPTGPVEVLGDSAYGTGEALAALDRAGHTPVIKPWPLRPAVPGGFTLAEFTIDEAAGTATCPHGLTRPISRTRSVRPAIAARQVSGSSQGASGAVAKGP